MKTQFGNLRGMTPKNMTPDQLAFFSPESAEDAGLIGKMGLNILGRGMSPLMGRSSRRPSSTELWQRWMAGGGPEGPVGTKDYINFVRDKLGLNLMGA